MKKIFNDRPIVLFLIGLMFGAFIALTFCLGKVALCVTLFCLLLISGVALFVFANKINIKRWVSICLLAFTVLGAVSVYFENYSYTHNNFVDGCGYSFSGRITKELGASANGEFNYYQLEDVQINKADNCCSGNALCFIPIEFDYGFKVGDRIQAYASFNAQSLNDLIEYSNYRKEIKITIFVQGVVSVIEKTKLTIFENIKNKVYSMFETSIGDKNSGLFYAMIMGDTSHLSSDTYGLYRDVGIAHLLAVSGLHIGFLVLLLTKCLDKLKCNKKQKFYILTPILFVYAFFCEFSPSVLRAFIMTAVCLFGSAYRKQYDPLCALCFSALLILIFKPLYIMDKGFILSFCAVLAILTLMPPLKHKLEKVLNEKFASSVALAVSVQFGVLPFSILFYNSFSVMTIIVNILLIPIASFAYMFMLVVTVLSFIFPFFTLVLKIPSLLMNIVSTSSQFILKLPPGNIKIKSNIFASIPALMIMPFCGDLCFLENKTKLKTLFVLGFIYILLLILFNL